MPRDPEVRGFVRMEPESTPSMAGRFYPSVRAHYSSPHGEYGRPTLDPHFASPTLTLHAHELSSGESSTRQDSLGLTFWRSRGTIRLVLLTRAPRLTLWVWDIEAAFARTSRPSKKGRNSCRAIPRYEGSCAWSQRVPRAWREDSIRASEPTIRAPWGGWTLDKRLMRHHHRRAHYSVTKSASLNSAFSPPEAKTQIVPGSGSKR